MCACGVNGGWKRANGWVRMMGVMVLFGGKRTHNVGNIDATYVEVERIVAVVMTVAAGDGGDGCGGMRADTGVDTWAGDMELEGRGRCLLLNVQLNQVTISNVNYNCPMLIAGACHACLVSRACGNQYCVTAPGNANNTTSTHTQTLQQYNNKQTTHHYIMVWTPHIPYDTSGDVSWAKWTGTHDRDTY